MRRNDLAEAAVGALVEAVEITPKPGLTDGRGPGVGPGCTDPATARWAAKALYPGLTAMAAAARRGHAPGRELRQELGEIGRATERTVRLAAGGASVHRGAVWALGLLVAAATLEPDDPTGTAKSIAALNDRNAPRRPTAGSGVASTYGAAGAKGEARAGFPHARRALSTLRSRRDDARPDALIGIMSTLQDTGPLHTAGPAGLRLVQSGARAVLEAGGTGTEAGREAVAVLEADLRRHRIRPGGSEPLLAAALFLDRLGQAR
ncbi:triphosphoribosyl-dephospho-CoA synthase [Streptomyces sp. NPDC002809]|uniref:triphosphoribosyl-dephospho-CoA synthase n=1 Tax=Streptomyces sp. NPDC002809 TaxID=3154433 RepID=UPI00332F549D